MASPACTRSKKQTLAAAQEVRGAQEGTRTSSRLHRVSLAHQSSTKT